MVEKFDFEQIEELEGKEDSLFNQAECLSKIENEAIQSQQLQIVQSPNKASEIIDTSVIRPKPQEVSAPLSAYVLFIKDLKLKIDRGEVTITDKKNFLQDASQMWQSLAQEEKEGFQKQALEQKEAYNEFKQN